MRSAARHRRRDPVRDLGGDRNVGLLGDRARRLAIGGRTLGFGITRTERPSVTRSMRSALADLELDHLCVVHAGTRRFALDERITAIGAAELLTGNEPR